MTYGTAQVAAELLYGRAIRPIWLCIYVYEFNVGTWW